MGTVVLAVQALGNKISETCRKAFLHLVDLTSNITAPDQSLADVMPMDDGKPIGSQSKPAASTLACLQVPPHPPPFFNFVPRVSISAANWRLILSVSISRC